MKTIVFLCSLILISVLSLAQSGNLVSRDSVYNCFETGDKPTQQQFWNWQYSSLFPAEDTIQDFYRLFNTRSNFLFGTNAGAGLTSGTRNIFLGQYAGQATTSGFGNYFLGYKTGYSNTTGYRNIFIGDSIGYQLSSGYKNIFIGSNIANLSLSGNAYENIALGDSALYSIGSSSNGANNQAYGQGAGKLITIGDHNLLMGKWAGASITTGSFNHYFGYQAGSKNNGTHNIFNGSFSGAYATGVTHSVCIGFNSGRDNILGDSNVYIGANSGITDTLGCNNVFVGSRAGRFAKGSRCVFIGNASGTYETNSDRLFIDNSSTSSPLIHGNFSSNRVTINTSLKVDTAIVDSLICQDSLCTFSDCVTLGDQDSVNFSYSDPFRIDIWETEGQIAALCIIVTSTGIAWNSFLNGQIGNDRVNDDIVFWNSGSCMSLVNNSGIQKRICYIIHKQK